MYVYVVLNHNKIEGVFWNLFGARGYIKRHITDEDEYYIDVHKINYDKT